MRAASKTCLQLTVILIGSIVGTSWTYHFKADRPALYLSPERPATPGIALTEILSWVPAPVWVDSRPEIDFTKGHIPGAISIHPDNLESALKAHFDLFTDQRKVFVLYGSEKANRIVAERLESLGQKKVHVLKGGWEAWQSHSS